MSRRKSRRVEYLSEYDPHSLRRSPRLRSSSSRDVGSGPLSFPLSSATYSATSRQTLSGFKDYEETATSNILNESGQSVPQAFDEDIHQDGGMDLPEHLYGLDGSGEDDVAQPELDMEEAANGRYHVHKERVLTPPRTPQQHGDAGSGIVGQMVLNGLLLLYKFGSLFYLIAAGIFSLDVMILHRIYTVFHAMAGGMETRPTKSWQRFYVLPLVLGALVVFLLGGGLIPPESTPLEVRNGTEINLTEVRVQVVKVVTPMILEELRNSFQANIEMQVEKHVQGAIAESETRLQTAVNEQFGGEAETREKALKQLQEKFWNELNVSLEHHLSTLQASVEQQVSQLQQKILDQSEGGVTEALVSEMVRSQVEKMSMDQLQETNSKLQEAKSEFSSHLEQFKDDMQQLQGRDKANTEKLADVVQQSEAQSSLGGKVEELETTLQGVTSDVSKLTESSKKHGQQLQAMQQEDAELLKSITDFKQKVMNRVTTLEEASKETVTPAEAVTVFNEELRKVIEDKDSPLHTWFSRSLESLDGLPGTEIRKQDIDQLIKAALYTYNADKVAKFDFALENSGGSIIAKKCSQTYAPTQGTVSFLGFPLWRVNSSPKLIIQSSVYPGDCWAFEGSNGHALIKLQGPVRITGVTLEHVPKELTPNGSRASAPKEFQVWGKNSPDEEPGVLLGKFVYNLEDTPIQQFDLSETDGSAAYDYVYFDFLSNHGNEKYTCVYRVRVHGQYAELK